MSTAYRVRRLKLRKTDPLDRLARASGALYSQALVSFWRVVRKKEIWLSPTALMKLFRSDQLHSQSAQATLQVFCASLKSWRQRRKRIRCFQMNGLRFLWNRRFKRSASWTRKL